MKYYIVVLNPSGDILGIFESFSDVVNYIENAALNHSSYRIQLISKAGV